MITKWLAGLIACFVIIPVTSFGDIVAPESKWPSQTIRFAATSTLGGYLLYIHYEPRPDRRRDPGPGKKFLIPRDTTFFFPEYIDRAPKLLSFFAVSNKKSTDTIEVEGNTEIVFKGVQNNKLQFSMTELTATRRSTAWAGRPNKTTFNGMGTGARKSDQLLVGLSFTGLLGLILFFKLYKSKRRQAYDNAAA